MHTSLENLAQAYATAHIRQEKFPGGPSYALPRLAIAPSKFFSTALSASPYKHTIRHFDTVENRKKIHIMSNLKLTWILIFQ